MNERDRTEKRKAEALERLADVAEEFLDMVAKRPTITTQTPAAPAKVKVEEPKDNLPDDTVEVLGDSETESDGE